MPRPSTVEAMAILVKEESVLKAYTVDDSEARYKVEMLLCVFPTRVENVEKPSLIMALEIVSV